VIWILFAAVTITGLIILSGVEYGKRLAAEHRVATLEAQLDASEGERILLQERATRLNRVRARRVGGAS